VDVLPGHAVKDGRALDVHLFEQWAVVLTLDLSQSSRELS
jgi:hypothetical protein